MHILGTPQLARILHPFVGVVMFASFIIMFFRYWHHNLINRDDIFWAKNIRKIVVNEEVGDTGRYNFGQKCVFWAAIIFGTAAGERCDHLASVFCAGFSIPVIRFALMLHSFAAVALIVVIMVHIYAALWVHHYRDGGRLGYQNVGEETSPALVPSPPETGKVI